MTHLVLRFLLTAVLPAVLLRGPAAHAQPKPANNVKLKAAKSYVDSGLIAQNSGDYDTAILLYTKAYQLVPHPVLLFNIAQCHRLAKREDQAAELYEQFLATNPTGPEAQVARDHLAAITKRQRAEARKADEARKAEDARAVDDSRKTDEARDTEETREAEEARTAEDARKTEDTRETEDARKADGPKVRKRGRDADGGGDVHARPAWPLPAARVSAGLAYGSRTLSYTVEPGAAMPPPTVDSQAKSIRFEGEIYPFAFADRESPLAGLGGFIKLDWSFGLSIPNPDSPDAPLPIDQGHYAIGARYRLVLGRSALSGGLAYTRRYYIADRSSLPIPTQLDMPDVDYAAVSPVLGARTQVAAQIALFAELDAMLVLSAGQIAETESYGAGDLFGIGGNGGIDISLGKQISLRLAAEFNQVNVWFEGTGVMSMQRGVSAATDRDYAVSATFAASY